jgi:CheY-like chemotaxis protein
MKKILAVDDDIGVLMSVKEGLNSLASGYEVVLANNGKECFEILKTGGKPDLIILDLMMPGMDGWEIQRKLRGEKEWRDIPIMFLTAKTDNYSKRMGNIVGKDFIEKPFEIKDLKRRIETLIN